MAEKSGFCKRKYQQLAFSPEDAWDLLCLKEDTIAEREDFYEKRYRQILPSSQRGWKDVWEFLSFPACTLSDCLYLRRIKKAYMRMRNPFSDENINKMADFLVKAVIEDKKMSVDFLASVGDYWLFDVAQKKIDRYRPELSNEFHQRTEEIWDDVCDVRYLRDVRFCQSYFRKKPEKIAIFTGREMNHLLKRMPHRQARKLFFVYLRNNGKEKGD